MASNNSWQNVGGVTVRAAVPRDVKVSMDTVARSFRDVLNCTLQQEREDQCRCRVICNPFPLLSDFEGRTSDHW